MLAAKVERLDHYLREGSVDLTGVFLPGEVREKLTMEGTLVMSIKKYKPEQIVTILRQMEV